MKATQARWTRGPKTLACSVGGCERSGYAKGFCRMHYRRSRESPGGVGPVELLLGGDDITYDAIHLRVRVRRGRAREHPCAHCGDPAVQWAYDHRDPNERFGPKNRSLVAYSLDIDRYIPLCVPCHNRFDVQHRKRSRSA
jgi:hypothetical protein